MNHPILTPQEKESLLKKATYASVSVALILIIAKLYAWYVTDSVSLLSTLVDSILDAGASLITLVAVHHAMKPADDDHKFGHGKAEALAGLVQSVLIALSAVFLLVEVGIRIFSPEEIHRSEIGIIVVVFAIVLTFFLLSYQHKVVKKTNSVAIKADSMHYKTDLYINLGVLFALVVSKYTDTSLVDTLLGGVITCYILYSAWKVAKQVSDILMDKELSADVTNEIRSIVVSNKKVKGIHDLRTRSTGHEIFIQLHMELNGKINLFDAHDISDEVSKDIRARFHNAEVLIHLDPLSEGKKIY